MGLSSGDKNRFSTKNVVLIAVMAATLVGGKMALAFVPNVEIVTLLCALYGYVFGVLGLVATFIFVMCEMTIWGFGTWVATYLIYWPLVCCTFWLLAKCKVKNRFILTLTAVILTIFFGVLTSLVDVGLFMGLYDNFFYRFWVYYAKGFIFYLAQIICNIACFIFAFKPLSRVLLKYKNQNRLL